MAKKINDILKQIPKGEKHCLEFKKENGEIYIVTKDNDSYYLYLKTEEGYKYIKSRKKDPCFPECY